MSEISPWLADALANTEAAKRTPSVDLMDLEPGDLWVFADRPTADATVRRIALVLDTDQRTRTVTAALASPEVALAAPTDVVLDPAELGTPYPLMIESGFVALLPWGNACTRVGKLDDALLDDLIDFVWDERPEALEGRRGAPWTEPANEERKIFESEELSDLESLARSTDSRFGGSTSDAPIGITTEAAVGSEAGLPEAHWAHQIFEMAGPTAVCFADVLRADGSRFEEFDIPIDETLSDADARLLATPVVDALLTGHRLSVHLLDGQRVIIAHNYERLDVSLTLMSSGMKRRFGRGHIGWTPDRNPVFVDESAGDV